MISDYRSLILSRLKKRDQQCAIFESVFEAHTKLSESLNHLLVVGTSTAPDENKPLTECDNKPLALRSELSEVYKLNAINNQQLINANARLIESEKILANVKRERNEAHEKLRAKQAKLAEILREFKEYKEANELLNDECIAAETLYNTTTDRLIVAEAERAEYKIRVEKLTERSAELMKELQALDAPVNS